MGKRKRCRVVRPWCWYCEREFDDVSSLLHHQKAKHFKCPLLDCRRTFHSIWHLSEHTETSHFSTIESIPNALSHRNDLSINVVGMDGIPENDYYEHEKEILGDMEATKPKGPSYDELSVDQLRTQVAQYQASIQCTHSSMEQYHQQQQLTNNHCRGAIHSGNGSSAYSHNSHRRKDRSNYHHPPPSSTSGYPPKTPQSPKSPTIPPPPPPPLDSLIDPSSPPPPPPPLDSLSDPPPPPPPPDEPFTSPPSITTTPHLFNTSPSIHSLPTPSSINGTTSHRHLQYQPASSGTTPNLGSAVLSVSPSARDRLTSRRPIKTILVYPYENLSPDELRAASMSKS